MNVNSVLNYNFIVSYHFSITHRKIEGESKQFLKIKLFYCFIVMNVQAIEVAYFHS